jgi:hypothetical protein
MDDLIELFEFFDQPIPLDCESIEDLIERQRLLNLVKGKNMDFMNVRQLINELEKIENKDLTVLINSAEDEYGPLVIRYIGIEEANSKHGYVQNSPDFKHVIISSTKRR